jgi:branched-chain amino acid transport system substrate-binding protein
MIKTILILLFCTLELTFVYSQENPGTIINTNFAEAVNLYESAKYEEALRLFNIIILEKYNSKTTVSKIFKAKILLAREKYSESEQALLDFLKNCPESKYIDEAKFMLVDLHLKRKEYSKSFKQAINLIETGSINYKVLAKNAGEKIALYYFDFSDLKKIYDVPENIKVKPFLLLLLGKMSLRNGDYSNAQKYFSDLISLFPDSPEKNEARILQEKALKSNSETSPVSTPLIGVLLPLNKIGQEETQSVTAAEILEGIKFAISEYNNGRDNKIGLIIRNTANDETRIAEIRDEFDKILSIKAILGPVFSDEVRSALEIFKSTDIPILSPTATDNDLTQTNENFFQANPNFIIRGKAMAQYIFYVENKRRVAVLNAIEGYSPLLAAEFSNEFEKLGGEILVKATYKSNSFTLNDQIKKISLYRDSLEGLYLPLADKADVPVLLSNLVQDSLYIPIYGNQDWFLAKGYETSSELSNSLTFESDYFLDYNDADFQNFANKFSQKTRIDANRNVLYGYDVAKYLLTIMRHINIERETIALNMESGITSSGYHNNICFNEDRVNRFVNIVRYKDGVFELIDKFKVN